MATSSPLTDEFVDLVQKFITLKPRLILPEHIQQLKKKMESLHGTGNRPEDHSSLFRILILLARAPGPLTMTELSAELNVPTSTATRIVDWLVRGGFVERTNDPNDRRLVRVGISQAGRELYETGLAYNKQRVLRLLAVFSAEEQEQLLKLMRKLLDSLSTEKQA